MMSGIVLNTKAKRGEDEYSNKQLWQNKDDLGNNKLVTIN